MAVCSSSACNVGLINPGDICRIDLVFRSMFQTRYYALGCPKASIVRFSEAPSPELLTETKITDTRLNITYNIVGRSLTLTEGALTQAYVVTGYTATSITVLGATFLTTGFTIACTYTIAGRPELQQESPTKVQLLAVGSQSLLLQPVAWYNMDEKEIRQYGSELTTMNRRFVFFDIRVVNSDIIILNDTITTLDLADDADKFEVGMVRYHITYDKSNVFAKAIT